jgi:hypothetical protein
MLSTKMGPVRNCEDNSFSQDASQTQNSNGDAGDLDVGRGGAVGGAVGLHPTHRDEAAMDGAPGL